MKKDKVEDTPIKVEDLETCIDKFFEGIYENTRANIEPQLRAAMEISRQERKGEEVKLIDLMNVVAIIEKQAKELV